MKKVKLTKSHAVLDRYIYHTQNCDLYCKAIQEAINNHFGDDPSKINWSHIGSVEYVSELLQEICNFLNLKVEGK